MVSGAECRIVRLVTQLGDKQATPPRGAQPSRRQVQALIEQYGLKRAGARAPLSEYIQDLWGRRHFVVEFSKATNASGYSRSMLGQAWQVLTPLLNAAVYYVIFGLLLHVNRGISNYIGFLVTGVFVFQFIQNSVNAGSRSLHANLSLARTLRFPRAVFPVSSTAIALQQLLMSLIALIPIVLLTGEPLNFHWLELIPAIVLETGFCMGMGLIFARIGVKVPDVSQMLPFVMRVWFYISGVMFSINHFPTHVPHVVEQLLNANPAAMYLALFRGAIMTSSPSASATQWLGALAWSVVILVVGFVFFWKAEEAYGRD